MAEPGIQEYTLDIVNTSIGIAYLQSTEDFAAMRAFDVIPTTSRMGQYIVYERGAFMRDKAQRRGDSQESSGSGYTFARNPYFCEVFAHHKDIGHITRGMAESFIRAFPMAAPAMMTPEAVATLFVTRILLIRWEKMVMDRFFTSGVWETDVNGGTDFEYWNAGAAATVQANVLAAKRAVLLGTGFEPNSMLISYGVFQALALDPTIRQRFQFTSSESLTEEMLARYLQLQNVYVAKAVEAVSDEDAAVFQSAFIPPDAALLYYRPDNPGPLTPASAYTFAWTGVNEPMGEIMGVGNFYINFLKTTRVEAEMAIDPVLVGAPLGYMFNGVLAA